MSVRLQDHSDRSTYTDLLVVEVLVSVLECGLLEHVGPLAAHGRRQMGRGRGEGEEPVHVDPLHVRHPRAVRQPLRRQLHFLVEL